MDINKSMSQQSKQKRLRYFIPDWDDLVDPNYNFITDTYAPERVAYDDDVYAHQIYAKPAYDGLLVSKAKLEKSKRNMERVETLGVHASLRVSRDFPVLGDSGAFDYITADEPPYQPDEIVDYYERCDFNFGVSIDHLIIPQFYDQREKRMQITIENAREMLRIYKRGNYSFRPIGAVQGWDPKSYQKCAESMLEMGYDYIGLGGMVRSTSKDILAVLEAVHPILPKHVDVHLFGIARLDMVEKLVELGVTSIDSASPLRKAWTDSTKNYHVFNERKDSYMAVRVPMSDNREYNKLYAQKWISPQTVQAKEKLALQALRDYEKNPECLEHTYSAVLNYVYLKHHASYIPLWQKLLSVISELERDLDQIPLNLFEASFREIVLQFIQETQALYGMPKAPQYEVETWEAWGLQFDFTQFKSIRKKLLQNFALLQQNALQPVENEVVFADKLNEYPDVFTALSKVFKMEKSLFLAVNKAAGYEVKLNELLREVLQARPWEECHCEICQEVGIEVIIFRANNRNRRRGFHNTKIFFERLQEILAKIEKSEN